MDGWVRVRVRVRVRVGFTEKWEKTPAMYFGWWTEVLDYSYVVLLFLL